MSFTKLCDKESIIEITLKECYDKEMRKRKDVKNWAEVSDFFLNLEIQTQRDYEDKLITKNQRDIKIKQIRKDWNYNMVINNPFLKDLISQTR